MRILSSSSYWSSHTELYMMIAKCQVVQLNNQKPHTQSLTPSSINAFFYLAFLIALFVLEQVYCLTAEWPNFTVNSFPYRSFSRPQLRYHLHLLLHRHYVPQSDHARQLPRLCKFRQALHLSSDWQTPHDQQLGICASEDISCLAFSSWRDINARSRVGNVPSLVILVHKI